MAPIWPFRRSRKTEDSFVDSAPEPIVYRKDQEVHTEKHKTTLQRDENAYKDALALFGGGDTSVSPSGNVADAYDGATESVPLLTPSTSGTYEWVRHTDGYYYKKTSDGQFEPTPYVKNDDGSYTAYA